MIGLLEEMYNNVDNKIIIYIQPDDNNCVHTRDKKIIL